MAVPPTALTAVTDDQPVLFQAASEFTNGHSLSLNDLGALAWCHHRHFLPHAVQLIRDHGVPPYLVRKVVSELEATPKKEARDLILKILETMREAGISRTYLWEKGWEDIVVPATSLLLRSEQRIAALQNSLAALQQARALGIEKDFLVKGALILLEEGAAAPPATATDAAVDEAPQNPRMVLAGRAFQRSGIGGGDYWESLARWQEAGFTWEEHYFLMVLYRLGESFIRKFSPERLRREINVRGLELWQIEAIGSHEEGAEWNSDEEAFQAMAADWRKRMKILWGNTLDYSRLAAGEGFDLILKPKGMELQLEFFDKNTSRAGSPDLRVEAEIIDSGDTVMVTYVQCDGYRKLPPEMQKKFQHWEKYFFAVLEEWAREKKVQSILVNTVYGILGRIGTIAEASIKNLMRVYLFPGETGYHLVRLSPRDPAAKASLLTVIFQYKETKPVHYWEKRLVA